MDYFRQLNISQDGSAGRQREGMPATKNPSGGDASNMASQSSSMMMNTGTGLGATRVPLPIQIIQPSKVKDSLLEHDSGFRSIESKLSFKPKVFKFLFKILRF